MSTAPLRTEQERLKTQFAEAVTEKMAGGVDAMLKDRTKSTTAFTTLLKFIDTLFKREEYSDMNDVEKYKAVMSFTIDFVATFHTDPVQWGVDKWDNKITTALNNNV